MFQQRTVETGWQSALALAELVYHSIVRNLRKSHGNAVVGLLSNVVQMVVFCGVFYVMFTILGMRGAAIRGDFLLYVLSGIFMFLLFTKSMGAVAGAEGPTSAMMKHAPMNTVVAILAAALGTLYIQTLSLLAVLFVYHVAFAPVHIHDPVGALMMLLLCWFWGSAIGLVFLSLKAWLPQVGNIVTQLFARANMIASGKMFVANMMPAYLLSFFDWNPLFHIIDQTRGYMFQNYFPHFSNWPYALWCSVAALMLGLMAEFYTRRRASLSWTAGR